MNLLKISNFITGLFISEAILEMSPYDLENQVQGWELKSSLSVKYYR